MASKKKKYICKKCNEERERECVCVWRSQRHTKIERVVKETRQRNRQVKMNLMPGGKPPGLKDQLKEEKRKKL